jgi:hypothetical protein
MERNHLLDVHRMACGRIGTSDFLMSCPLPIQGETGVSETCRVIGSVYERWSTCVV